MIFYKNSNDEVFAFEDDISSELLTKQINKFQLTSITEQEKNNLLNTNQPSEFDLAMSNLRFERNNLLADTDYLALSDQTMSAEMTTYRQALRDITNGLTTVADVEAIYSQRNQRFNMAYIGRGTENISNVEVLDNLTFDGSASYTLQKSSTNFVPSSANNLLISISGVVQQGNFSVSGSTITFDTTVSASDTCDWILHYGTGLITTVADGAITEANTRQ